MTQDCSQLVIEYNCTSITSCMTTSGVCECANGNQCVWTNNGAQRVNCPCLNPAQGGYTDYSGVTNPTASQWCETIFSAKNCGYETTCNPGIFTATCRCPDGTTCIFSDSITLDCPCQNGPVDLETYKQSKIDECTGKKTEFNCPTDPIHCMGGIGTCKCNDGSLCAWGPGYNVNCPCNA